MSRQTYFFIILIFALLGGAFVGFKLLNSAKPNSTNKPPPSIPVKTTHAVQANMPVFINSIGTVISPHEIEIRPQVSGTITELLVQGGQFVNQGDLLARLDDQSIKAAIQQQQAELGNIKAQLNVAKVDLERYRQLSAQNAISNQSLEQQKALVNQLEHAILAKQAMIKDQEIKLSYTRILAPISGVVGVIAIHSGNYVQAGSSIIFSIAQVDPVQVEVAVTQKALSELLPMLKQQTLQQVPVFIYDNPDHTAIAQGTLAILDNQVSTQTGTIRLRAQFDNKDMTLWPGQTVSARIQIHTLENATVVPQTTIRQGQQSPFIWRIENDIASPAPIKILQTNQELVAVEGIEAGDEVVIDGASRLLKGARIQRIEQRAVTPEQPQALNMTSFLRMS